MDSEDDEVDLTEEKLAPVPVGAAAGHGGGLSQQFRDRTLERAAHAAISGTAARCTDSNGVVDGERVTLVLRRALAAVDADFKGAIEAESILKSLKEHMGRTGKTKIAQGVKRALIDRVAVGAAGGNYSARSAEKLTGLSRKRMLDPERCVCVCVCVCVCSVCMCAFR